MVIEQFDVYVVPLDPAFGVEMRKLRPCLVVSKNEMQKYLQTVVIVPMTSGRTGWPTRAACHFAGRDGEFAIDQVRSVDRRRLKQRIGRITQLEQRDLLDALRKFFG